MTLATLIMAVATTGCISTYLNDQTEGPDGKTTKEVTFYRGGLATATQFDSAEVNYQGVKAKIGGYTQKADSELVKELSVGVVGGLVAYSTGGLGAVPAGVESALKAFRAKSANTNEADAVSAPATLP